jgi:hypothetical protein
MSAEVQDLAVRYGAAWAAHDLDGIMALHTADTVFHLHGDTAPAVGSAATREAFATAMEQWPGDYRGMAGAQSPYFREARRRRLLPSDLRPLPSGSARDRELGRRRRRYLP